MSVLRTALYLSIASLVFAQANSEQNHAPKPSETEQNHSQAAPQPQTGSQQQPSPGAALTAEESKFISEALYANATEVGLGQLALARSSNPMVRAFAKRMINDHSTLDRETLAVARYYDLPTRTGIDRTQYAQLARLHGEQFDNAYVRMMVQNHENDVKEFEHMANTATSPRVRNLAASALPVLQSHLSEIQSIAQRLRTT
jgi:putative membrane protein